MECKKCGWSSGFSKVVFCGNCGARMDAKKECPSCKKMNDDDVSFCVFCGKQLNDGDFNADLGKILPTPASSAIDEISTKRGNFVREKKDGDIVGVLLLLFAVISSLIFVFFLGVEIFYKTQIYEQTVKRSIFYYFGEYYKEIENLRIMSYGSEWGQNLLKSQYIWQGILNAVTGALSILLVVVFAMIAAICFLRDRDIQKASKWGVLCVFSYIMGAILLCAINMCEIVSDEAINGCRMDNVTMIGVAFSLVFIIGFIVRKIIKNKKLLFIDKNKTNFILTILSLIFLGALLGSMKNLGVDYKNEDIKIGFIGFNLRLCTAFILDSDRIAGAIYTQSSVNLECMCVFNIVSQILVCLIAFISMVNICTIISNIIVVNKTRSGFVGSVFSLICSVALLICYVGGHYNLGGLMTALSGEEVETQVSYIMPIFAIAFSLLSVIVSSILEKRKEE